MAMRDEMNEKEPEVDIESTGEDNIDEPLIDEIEENTQAKIKNLQAKLKHCEAEKIRHLDDLQRTKADFLNAKRRLEEEKLRDKERVITDHIKKLLPLCDSFYMAMSNEEAWNAVNDEWRKGVESINTQLRKILQSYDVQEVNPLGEEFDPNQHEAMSEQTVANIKDDHKIVSVIQNGFIRKANDKYELIRPARVVVGIYNS